MNLKILLLIISAAIISSCSTTYKSGQTPDDVYYSPARPIETTYKKQEVKKNERKDRQLVMSIHDPRWRDFDDDYDASYDPYRYGYSCGYYYNPYYYPSPVYISGAPIIDPKNSTPRMTNLGSYNYYSNMVVVNPKSGATTMVRSARRYNNSNSDQNFVRRILAPGYNNSNSPNQTYQPSDNNTRTYSPSSSGRSGSSSGRSSGAPVSRPGRGG